MLVSGYGAGSPRHWCWGLAVGLGPPGTGAGSSRGARVPGAWLLGADCGAGVSTALSAGGWLRVWSAGHDCWEPAMGWGTPQRGCCGLAVGLGSPWCWFWGPATERGSARWGGWRPSAMAWPLGPAMGMGSPWYGCSSPAVGLESPGCGYCGLAVGLGPHGMGAGASPGAGTPWAGCLRGVGQACRWHCEG